MMKNILKIIIFTLILNSCASEYILDPIDHRLPIYSETGNNVAGALINDELWNSRSNAGLFVPSNKNFDIEINNTLDKVSFNFFGESTIFTRISIVIDNLKIEKFEDLEKLSNKKIILNGQNNFAVLSKNFLSREQTYTPTLSNGQLYIKNVYVDYGETTKIIISGTFGFSTNINNTLTEVSYGRFDYKISEQDFRIID